ncbi:hypothetical protein OKW42_006430 [Paraburkholderia sp. WC7.3d]
MRREFSFWTSSKAREPRGLNFGRALTGTREYDWLSISTYVAQIQSDSCDNGAKPQVLKHFSKGGETPNEGQSERASCCPRMEQRPLPDAVASVFICLILLTSRCVLVSKFRLAFERSQRSA